MYFKHLFINFISSAIILHTNFRGTHI